MDKIGLILTTSVIAKNHSRYQWEGKDSKGQTKVCIQFVTEITMEMTWINAEKPEEKLTTIWLSSGEDEDPAKANGKAHTYGERYYLLKFFNIPTDNEDPDAFQKKQEKAGNIPATNGNGSHKIEDLPLTQKERVLKNGIKRLGDADKFKAWRINNNLAEDLDKATAADLNFIESILREYQPLNRLTTKA